MSRWDHTDAAASPMLHSTGDQSRLESMSTLSGWFRAAYAWTLAKNWRTWIGHFLVVFLVAFVSPLAGFGAFSFYLGREWGQAETKMQHGVAVDWTDTWLDALGPFLALVANGILFPR